MKSGEHILQRLNCKYRYQMARQGKYHTSRRGCGILYSMDSIKMNQRTSSGGGGRWIRVQYPLSYGKKSLKDLMALCHSVTIHTFIQSFSPNIRWGPPSPYLHSSSVGGTPIVRTRACLTASQRTAIWATLRSHELLCTLSYAAP